MLGYFSLDIICSSKLTVFLELRSRKTVRFLEQIMSADKYPSIFSRQMKAIDYLILCPFTRGFEWFLYVTKYNSPEVSPRSTHVEANDKFKKRRTQNCGPSNKSLFGRRPPKRLSISMSIHSLPSIPVNSFFTGTKNETMFILQSWKWLVHIKLNL